MRLVDADVLLEQMKHRKEYIGRPSDPVCLVEDAPTVDAVPVRHGVWTIHEEGFSHEDCGYFVDDNFFTPYHREKVDSWKYCPRCGAKMNEGEVYKRLQALFGQDKKEEGDSK